MSTSWQFQASLTSDTDADHAAWVEHLNGADTSQLDELVIDDATRTIRVSGSAQISPPPPPPPDPATSAEPVGG